MRIITCKNCGKEVIFNPRVVPGLAYSHADGTYACNGSRPTPKVTYAEPEEVA